VSLLSNFLESCKKYKVALTWMVLIWMITVLVLLAVGPVWHP
jgi:hypothetical protein